MRAWVEIAKSKYSKGDAAVALHVRAWVEIRILKHSLQTARVALHVRAWVEIYLPAGIDAVDRSPSM